MSSENIATDNADLDLISAEDAPSDQVETKNEAPVEKVEKPVETKPIVEKKLTQREQLAKAVEAVGGEPKGKKKSVLFSDDGTAAAAETGSTAKQSVVKPPANLPADVREIFAEASPILQHHLAKRETEIHKALSENAAERKLGATHREIWAPYQEILRQSNASSEALTKEFAEMFYVFKTGTSAQKANIIANIVRSFPPTVADLTAALSQVPVPSGQHQQVQQPVNIQAEVQRTLQQRDEQAMHARAKQEADAFFANDKYEFREDVRPAMAALLNGNAASTLEEAYKMAVRADARVQKVLRDRQQKRALGTVAAGTGTRASSARPAPAPAPKAKSQRDALSQAFDRFIA